MTNPPKRSLRIGITGHRPNRMHIGVARVEQRLAAVLRNVRRCLRGNGGAPGRPVAVSALAEGADQIFASRALALGFELEALLPFASSVYETTFGDAAGIPAYRALLARAARMTELPGKLTDSTAAYEDVGHALVENSDIFLAVWDGEAAAGRGGTTEVIDYALGRGGSVIWIDAARDRPPLLLKRPTAGGRSEVPLRRLAGRAGALTPGQVARLVRHITERLP